MRESNLEPIYYTYVYRHPKTFKPFYVGKGKDNRYLVHLNQSRYHNKRLHEYIQKLEKQNLIPIIEKTLENVYSTQALAEEICLISVWGRKNYDKDGILLNHTKGGEGTEGFKMSEQARKNISEGTKNAMKDPVIRNKISIKATGRKCPESTKIKLSEHFSKTRTGAGNPSAKTWTIINPKNQIFTVDDLSGFCKSNDLSYVGLKSSFRSNRPVQKGNSKGWQLK